MVELSMRHPFAEWGFLYSPMMSGKGGRYPSVHFLTRYLETLPESINVALHMCGDGAPNLINGDEQEQNLLEIMRQRNGRIQLNFNAARRGFTTSQLSDFIAKAGVDIITQYSKPNASVVSNIQLNNHLMLFDASGGQGKLRDSWNPPLANAVCGYAGGLSPINIAEQLPLIHSAVGGNPYWIDMEGKLRDEKRSFYPIQS